MEFFTINPFNGQKLQAHSLLTDDVIESYIRESQVQFIAYRKQSTAFRSGYLLRVAKALKSFRNQLAEQDTLEMGKPFQEALAEVEKSATAFEYYAGSMNEALQTQILTSNYKKTKLVYKPLGSVLAIMPWNYPIWQVARAVAPNLALGNVVLLKHANLTAGTAKLLTEVFESAGAESGLKTVWNLPISHGQTARLIADSRVQGVTFTGSTTGGAQVAELAGRSLKKSVLELGGSDPYIVLKDANIHLAAEKCAASRLTNNGQSCVAAKRFLVDQNVREPFLDKFLLALQKPKCGDPMQSGIELGPMANHTFQQNLWNQVQTLEKKGAKVILTGGPVADSTGAFFKPMALLTDYSDGDSDKLDKKLELFGPVAHVISFQSEEDMIRLANGTSYGLGAAIFTQDLERARWLMEEEIESGMVVINDMLKSDPRVPFGGIKDSGYGRELGEHGLFEFANVKSVLEN